MDAPAHQPSPQGDRRNPIVHWWQSSVIGSVDHGKIVGQISEDGAWTGHYAFMIVMSAGIAVLGLLLSSPAVVIGAMLISPLMGPIIALGFALATFDSARMRRSLAALLAGTAMAVLFCVVIVWLSPLRTVTDEIAARTRPNLFDLLVALFSGLAGTYAMIRGRHGTIVGVAIATALMPPLAVVGFGLATANWVLLAGSFLLFFTNLMTIAAAAALLARIYGFAADLSPRQTRLQAVLVVAILAALAIPLGLSLRQIAWEALAARQAREAIEAQFGKEAKVSELDLDFHAEPIEIAATVLTPRIDGRAEALLTGQLATRLGQPVQLAIDQIRIGSGDSEAIELAAARSSQSQGAPARQRERLAERLALVAGVKAEDVLIDPLSKRAEVRAAPLPGASLASYRALERRVAEIETSWTVVVVPPAAALPDVELGEDGLDEAAREALATAAWAAKRLRLPIGVASARRDSAELVLQTLAEAGVEARRAADPVGRNVRLVWLAPGAATEPSAEAR